MERVEQKNNDIMAQNFPKLVKDINVQEAQQS